MRPWPDWQWQYPRAVRSRVPCRGKIPPRCVPGRQSVASFAPHASRKRSRTGKSPVRGKIRASCIRKRAGFGRICAPCIRNAPQIAVGGYTARGSCQEGALFAARAPRIMHSAQILPSAAEQRERSQPRRRPYGRRNGARAASCRAGWRRQRSAWRCGGVERWRQSRHQRSFTCESLTPIIPPNLESRHSRGGFRAGRRQGGVGQAVPPSEARVLATSSSAFKEKVNPLVLFLLTIPPRGI